MKIPAHTEFHTFLHVDASPSNNTFKLTGAKHLVTEKNILVYNNDKCSHTEERKEFHVHF